jgi:hypothetical protein
LEAVNGNALERAWVTGVGLPDALVIGIGSTICEVGLEHVPSGNFHANSAWLQCAVLAHNMIRWIAIAGQVRVDNQLIVARTLRTRLLAIPGRLVNRSGRPILRTRTVPCFNASTTLRPQSQR